MITTIEGTPLKKVPITHKMLIAQFTTADNVKHRFESAMIPVNDMIQEEFLNDFLAMIRKKLWNKRISSFNIGTTTNFLVFGKSGELIGVQSE